MLNATLGGSATLKGHVASGQAWALALPPRPHFLNRCLEFMHADPDSYDNDLP